MKYLCCTLNQISCKQTLWLNCNPTKSKLSMKRIESVTELCVSICPIFTGPSPNGGLQIFMNTIGLCNNRLSKLHSLQGILTYNAGGFFLCVPSIASTNTSCFYITVASLQAHKVQTIKICQQGNNDLKSEILVTSFDMAK